MCGKYFSLILTLTGSMSTWVSNPKTLRSSMEENIAVFKFFTGLLSSSARPQWRPHPCRIYIPSISSTALYWLGPSSVMKHGQDLLSSSGCNLLKSLLIHNRWSWCWPSLFSTFRSEALEGVLRLDVPQLSTCFLRSRFPPSQQTHNLSLTEQATCDFMIYYQMIMTTIILSHR